MKDLDINPSAIEVKEVGEQRKTKFMAKMVFQPGLPFWEYNEITKVLQEAKIEETQLEVDKSPRGREDGIFTLRTETTLHKKVIYKSECFYFQALNRKNALRKLEKQLS